MKFDARGRSYRSLTPESSPESALSAPKPRKPHTRKRPKSYIPRPPNAFLLFRSDFLKKGIIPANVESKQCNLSIVAAECWHRLTTEEKSVWKALAKEKEKEHARMYPEYQYRPEKRGPVQRRRKMMTREQEIVYCETLRATYLPEKTGPVIESEASTAPRKRKSRVKATAASKRSHPTKPPVEPPVPLPIRPLEGPIFMDSLRPPSPPHQWPLSYSAWQNDQAHTTLDSDLEPMAFVDFSSALSSENEMPMVDHWAEDPVLTPPPPSHIPIEELVPLNAAFHIREKYDMTRRGALFPTPSMDSQEAQAIFEPEPFFAPSGSTEAAYPAAAEVQDISSAGEIFQLFAFPQFDPSPSASHLSLPTGVRGTQALQLDVPLPSTSKLFPIGLEMCTQESLSSPSLRHPNLDSLTLSPDPSKLEKLEDSVGVDESVGLFGELSLGDESRLAFMGDVLIADVCSRENGDS